MGNVRFILAHANKARKLFGTYPKLINGAAGYTAAPAVIEEPGFPMVNAFNPDRSSTIWVTPASPNNGSGDVWFDIDLGTTAFDVKYVGVLGFGLVGGAEIGTVNPTKVYFQSWAHGGTYNGTPSGQYDMTDAIILKRDVGVVVTPPVPMRYWRVRFESAFIGPGFYVGSFVIGVGPVAGGSSGIADLGFLYARATETIVQPRSFVEGYGATPVITRTGLPYRRFEFTYENIGRATRDIYDSLLLEKVPITYVDPDDNPWEVVPYDEFARDHVWALPNLHTFTFGMRSLP